MPELRVHIGQLERVLKFEGSPKLSLLLREAGIAVSTPCGGHGICRRCALPATGLLEPPPIGGRALACASRLKGDAEVWLEETGTLSNITMAGPLPLMEQNPMPGMYGLAVDIGTTTLAVQLVNLKTSRAAAEAAVENRQARLSDNVIGRISAALSGRGREMQDLILGQLSELEEEACAKADINRADISRTIITGNTAMLYFYTGKHPASLAEAPFIADHLFGEWLNGNFYLPRCIGAFLGADLLLALLACGMCGREETALLADIGTNGEIALWHKGRLFCCAAAAGPAFEGGGIRQGMGSLPGAIDYIEVREGRLSCTTIGGKPAIGICGSGLIDALAALLELGLMEETGRLIKPEVVITPGVSLSQKDIRGLQLAKGAIHAAIRTLCDTAGVQSDEIRHVFLAGGFGTRMRAESAARIGLIPKSFSHKAIPLGNAALTGAAMMLLNQGLLPASLRLAEMAEPVTLSGNSIFADYFMEKMAFEEQ
jgi:uncharacterized 2Fe-2S/4Fe-4S cluster protein (DUF4445 family)